MNDFFDVSETWFDHNFGLVDQQFHFHHRRQVEGDFRVLVFIAVTGLNKQTMIHDSNPKIDRDKKNRRQTLCSSRKSTKSDKEFVTHSRSCRLIRVPTVSKNSRISCLESDSFAGAKWTHLGLFLRNISASSGSHLESIHKTAIIPTETEKLSEVSNIPLRKNVLSIFAMLLNDVGKVFRE